MTQKRIDRRDFIAGTAASFGSLLVGRSAPVGSLKLGVQLYTVRQSLSRAPEETLARIAAIGYRNVEVLSQGLRQMLPLLRRYDLKPASGHFQAPLVTGNWDAWRASVPDPPRKFDWNDAVQLAAEASLKYMVISYLMPGERGKNLDYYREFAEKMNKAGEASRAAGIKLCYHNHAFEFQPMEGSTPMKVFMDALDPALVGLEFDVFWGSAAGVAPETVLRDYSGRVPLIHLKDKSAELGQVFHERVPPESFKEVGSGVLDIPSILDAAHSAGVEYGFVEQDQCPGDPVESLQKSFQYLAGL